MPHQIVLAEHTNAGQRACSCEKSASAPCREACGRVKQDRGLKFAVAAGRGSARNFSAKRGLQCRRASSPCSASKRFACTAGCSQVLFNRAGAAQQVPHGRQAAGHLIGLDIENSHQKSETCRDVAASSRAIASARSARTVPTAAIVPTSSAAAATTPRPPAHGARGRTSGLIRHRRRARRHRLSLR